jgi:hypothetical protein
MSGVARNGTKQKGTTIMTATQTSREPKAKRLIDVPAPPTLAETDKPKTSMEWYEYDCRKFIEEQKQDGVPDEEIMVHLGFAYPAFE